MLNDLAKVCMGQMTVHHFAKRYKTGINKTRRAKKAWLEAHNTGRSISKEDIKPILYPPLPEVR
jgi:hypothetical protein